MLSKFSGGTRADGPASAHTPAGLLGEPGLSFSALDNVESNVFVADPKLNIVYMNKKATKTMQSLGRDVREKFGVRLSEVPAQLPHDAAFTFGPVTIDTHVNSFPGSDGSVAGYVVGWEDVTEQRASQARALALVDRLGETQEVSAVMQTVASATEEMAAVAQEIARNAVEATTTVQSAVSVVESANQTMNDLGNASEQISGVVKAISAVAQQTNLLALNATIEAARAGESGKGFAVVAGEVKELSKQTQEATEQINQMIAGVQRLSQAAIQSIARISEVVERVSRNQESIASAVEQQQATTQDISLNVADAARRAEDIATFVSSHR